MYCVSSLVNNAGRFFPFSVIISDLTDKFYLLWLLIYLDLLLLGDSSTSVFSVPAYLPEETPRAFYSKLSFQGCLCSEQLQKIEIYSPSGAKNRFTHSFGR